MTADTLRAENLTRDLAETAPEYNISMIRLPTLPYGYSEHHMTYAGTVTLQSETYQMAIEDIGKSMAAHGAKRLVLINFHGGNREPLKLAGDRIQRDYDLPTYFVHWTDYARDQLQEKFGDGWGHAGEHETSVIELFHPGLVREEKKEPQTRKAEFENRQYTSDNWDWTFTDPAEQEYEKLQPHEQERIASKLDEIVTDQWRNPGDYLEPLTGAPHSKLRSGAFRLGCEADHSGRALWYTLAKSVQEHTNRATINRPPTNGTSTQTALRE